MGQPQAAPGSSASKDGLLVPSVFLIGAQTMGAGAGSRVGEAVITNRPGPVAVDGGDVVVEVAMPAAARAVIGDRPGQPVPLDGAGRVIGVQDQPGQPVPAQGVVGGLVAGQPGAARRVAELAVDGPSAGPGR